MAEEFKVLIGTELNTASIDSLKQQISGIKTNPIKIKIDTSDVTSQINKIKNQIQNLSGIKINLTGSSVEGKATKNVSEVTKAYNDLMNIQKRLNSTRIKINGLDATKDVKQINTLSGQLQRLQTDYNNLYQTFNKHFSTDQLDNLNRAFEVTSNQITATNSKMSDTSAIKQQETAYKELLNISQQISKTELKIGGLKGLGGHTNEIAELKSQLNNLKNTYQQLATSMQGNLSTDQLRTLSQQTYDTTDKLNVLNARIQDTKQKLATTSLNNFANDTGKIDKISEQFKNLKNRTVEVENAMKQFKQSVLNMDIAKQSGDVDKIVQSYKEYENAVKRVSAELKRASSVDSLNQARTALSSQMDVWLNSNSAAAAKFGSQIKTLQKELMSCDATKFNGIKSEFTEITRQAQIAGVATQSFGDTFKDQLSKLSTYFSANMLIINSIHTLKEMYQNIINIDTAFTELKKVTDETNSSYNKFLSNAAGNAKEIGTTIDNYITSTADFARLGYTFDQSQNLAKVANIYNVVGDEIANVNEATESIISTMKAFNIEADNSINIVDKFNEVGNNFAISSGGIGEAMKRSSSSMAAANNTIDETIALITAANAVVQDTPRVGNAFKTISMRIRGAETELKEAGLDTEGMAESVAKLREEIKALSDVDIMLDDVTFKSTYQIMDELSTKWKDLTDIQQASITELIAGKHQGNVMSSLMNNFDIARQALKTSLNSEGSAMKEHDKWMESLEAKMQKLAATFQSLSQTFLSSDFLKGMVDGITGVVNALDWLINRLGVIPTLSLGAGLVGIITNFKELKSVLIEIGSVNIVESISKLNDVHKVIDGGTGLLTKISLDGVVASLEGLSLKQAEVVLSTTALTKAQKQQVLVAAGLAESQGSITMAMTARALNQAGLSVETQTLIMQELGLQTAIDTCSAAELRSTLIKNGVAAATADEIIANAGLTASNAGVAFSFDALTVSITAAATAIKVFLLTNPVGWAILASGAIYSLVKVYGFFTESMEEAKEKSAESRKEYETTTSELASLNSELETTKKRIDELKAKGSLNIVEKEELETLKQQNNELERQKAIKEKIAVLQRKEAAEDANNVLTKKTQSPLEWINDRFDNQNGVDHNKSNDARDIIERTKEKQQLVNQYESERKNLEKRLTTLIPRKGKREWWQSKNEYELVEEEIEKYSKLKSDLEKELSSDLANIDTEYQSLFDLDGNVLHGYEETVQRVEELYNYMFSSSDKAAGIAEKINKIFERPTLSNVKEELIKIAEESNNVGITTDTIKEKYPELAQACKETGVSIQDIVDFINSTADIIDVDEVKSQLKKAFTIKDEKEEFDNFLDGLSIDELKVLYGIYESTDTSGWSIDDFKKAILDASETEISIGSNMDELTNSTQTAINSISKLNEVLNTQTTGTSILLDDYNSDELKDYQSALEYVNGSMQLNADKVREIAKAKAEEQIATNNANKESRQAQYIQNINQIKEYKKQLKDKNNLTDEEIENIKQQIAFCQKQNTGYLTECEQLDILNASLRESISTYNEWKTAQNASESGDMFDDTLKAIQTINDTLNNKESDNYGRIGREDYNASLNLIVPETIDKDNQAKINKYLDSIKDLFVFDNDGNRTGLNIETFCKQAVNKGLMVLDKAGKNYEIAGGKTMEDFANGMNLSMPLVQAMFGEMEEFGGEFDWGDEIFDSFGDGIIATEEQIQTLSKKLKNLEKSKKKGIDIDDSQIRKVEKILEECKQKKTELSHKSEINIETYVDTKNTLEKANAKVKELREGLENAKGTELEIQARANFKDAKEKADKLQKKIGKLQKPTQLEVQLYTNNIDKKLEEINTLIKNYENKNPEVVANLSDDEIKQKISSLEQQAKKLKKQKIKIQTELGSDETLDGLKEIDKTKIDDKDFDVNIIDNATKELERIDNMELHKKEVEVVTKQKSVIDKAKDFVNKITGENKAYGTAYVSGTADVSGDWGNKEVGKTLVGELGRELMVFPSTGKWCTVGDNGAEFVNVPKNAIVFNHLQTEDLLSKGFTSSRAVALARGNALVNGNAMVGGGISVNQSRKPYINQAAKNKADKKNKKSNKDADKKADKAESKAEKALEKFQEWISKLFDWIEIKIKRQSEKIDKYVTKAKNAEEASKYDTSAKNYRNTINATTTQIAYEQKATKKYNKQANKVVNKAVSMNIVSKKQANSIKKQMQNGSMNIKNYSDKVQEVIKDYQNWYEKSKEASKAVEELHNNIRTYIQDLKDMRDAQRNARQDTIDTYTSIGTSGFAYSHYMKNNQLNLANSQLNAQNKAYNVETKSVKKDSMSISKSGNKAIKKALNSNKLKHDKSKEGKAYKNALNNAQKAVKSKKAVSNKDLSVIKSNSVSIYNKLYAYNLSLKNINAARLEQALNYASTSAEKYNNISEKYNNKDEKNNSDINLYKAKSSNVITSKEKNNLLDKTAQQYDILITDDKSEIKKYQKNVNKNGNKIARNTGVTAKYKKSNKSNKYRKQADKYIKRAKNSINNKKTIGSATIAKLAELYSKGYVSQSFYEACVDYNNAIQHRREAEAQLEIDKQTVIQEKASIGNEKFNNIEQEYTNKQNKIGSEKSKESVKQSIKTTKGIDLTTADYKKLLDYSKQEEKNYSNEIIVLNKTIKENLDNGYWKENSQEYLDALNSVRGYEEQVHQCQKEQEELNNEIAQLPYTIFDKAVTLIQSVRSNFQSLLSIKSTRGVSKTNSDILTEIEYVNNEIDKQTKKKEQLWEDYQKALNDSNGVYGGKAADEWLIEYNNTDTAINNLKADVESLNNEIAQLPYQTYEKALSLLDGIAKYNKSVADLTKAQGRDLSVSDYTMQIDDNNSKIAQYENERTQAYIDYMKALSNYDGAYGGMTSDEWLTKYHDLGSTINELKVNNEDIRDALRDDVYWRNFERAHKSAKMLSDIISGISDLIDDTMLFKNGKFTDFGVSYMANVIKQYETARTEVNNYTNDIKNLNSLYSEGYYNQDEFNEKLNELQNGLFNAASSMKSYISEIIDMNKKLAQSELDELFKLIDARNDALTAKKNYYDYDKTIKDKTKDIQALQAQIGALEGVETAEAKAQKARLEADLADKKNDLNDTIMNHSFELSKDALNELKTILQDEFDEKWDNISQNLDEIQKLITAANELTAAQSHTIGNALNKLLSFYGINPASTDLNQFGNVTGYSSGTRKVDKDKMAWTQEDGKGEVIIRKSDGAILTPLSHGDSVVPNNLSNNLFDWGKNNPQEFADSLIRGVPDIPKTQSPVTTVEQHYSSLLNVEGNVDSTVVTDLEKFAKSFYKGAYNYTVNEIAKDARKKGIKA